MIINKIFELLFSSLSPNNDNLFYAQQKTGYQTLVTEINKIEKSAQEINSQSAL